MSAKATVSRLHPTVAALLILAAILAVVAGSVASVWKLTHQASDSARLHTEQVKLLNAFHRRHIGADVVTGVPSYSLSAVPDAAFQIEVHDPDTVIAQPPTGADGGPVILSSNGPSRSPGSAPTTSSRMPSTPSSDTGSPEARCESPRRPTAGGYRTLSTRSTARA